MWCICAQCSHVPLFAAPWTIAHQAPLSMGFPKQEYWIGLLFLSPGDRPDPGIKPTPLASPALVDKYFTTSTSREAHLHLILSIYLNVGCCYMCSKNEGCLATCLAHDNFFFSVCVREYITGKAKGSMAVNCFYAFKILQDSKQFFFQTDSVMNKN